MGSNAPGPGPVEYVDVALGDTDAITCMKSGLILVADESDQRLAVLVNSSENGVNRGQINVEAMARTREEAEASIFEYIEVFYNRQRRHSSLGFKSPAEYERPEFS